MVKSILNWNEKRFENAVKDENAPRSFAKAIACGSIECCVNTFVILGMVKATEMIVDLFRR